MVCKTEILTVAVLLVRSGSEIVGEVPGAKLTVAVFESVAGWHKNGLWIVNVMVTVVRAGKSMFWHVTTEPFPVQVPVAILALTSDQPAGKLSVTVTMTGT